MDFDDLNGDDLDHILGLISSASGGKKHGGQTKEDVIVAFLKHVGANISARSFSSSATMQKAWGAQLRSFIEAQPDVVCETVFAFCGKKYGIYRKSILKSLLTWMDPREIWCPNFISAGGSEAVVRRYLVFRSEDAAPTITQLGQRKMACKVSLMEITFDPEKDYLPQFVTKRAATEGEAEDQELKGFLFEDDKGIYSFGKTNLNAGFRFAQLSHFRRRVPGKDMTRTDLCGVRVGFSTKHRRQYAHLIYAYELVSMTETQERDLLGMNHFNEEAFLHVDPATQELIVSIVCPKELIDGGLHINRMPV